MIIIRHLTKRNLNRLTSRVYYVFHNNQKEKFNILSKKFADIYNKYRLVKNDYFDFLVPNWRDNEVKIEDYFLNRMAISFLSHSIIRRDVFIDFGGTQQKKELEYLESQFSETELKSLLLENNVGQPTLTNFHYKTSHNSIHHLTHVTKFAEHAKINLNNTKQVVEWGGGYGNLARIFIKINPNVTYVMIDIPIFSFIQALYLSTIYGEEKINMILNEKDTIQTGKINIIPLNKRVLEKLNIKNTDIFVSTWALSESTGKAIDFVSSKNFFDAEYLLIGHQQKSATMPFAEDISQKLSNYNIIHHEKIPLLKNNYYLFAKKNK